MSLFDLWTRYVYELKRNTFEWWKDNFSSAPTARGLLDPFHLHNYISSEAVKERGVLIPYRSGKCKHHWSKFLLPQKRDRFS